MSPTHTVFPVAQRVNRFSYAIRNIAVEAERLEAAGTRVRYLNVGNPPAFGFQPPEHMVEAVVRALRDGQNGYGPSVGVRPAREAIAQEYTGRGWPVSGARRCHLRTSAIEPPARCRSGYEVLRAAADYPLYTAVLPKIGASGGRTDPTRGWIPIRSSATLITLPRARS